MVLQRPTPLPVQPHHASLPGPLCRRTLCNTGISQGVPPWGRASPPSSRAELRRRWDCGARRLPSRGPILLRKGAVGASARLTPHPGLPLGPNPPHWPSGVCPFCSWVQGSHTAPSHGPYLCPHQLMATECLLTVHRRAEGWGLRKPMLPFSTPCPLGVLVHAGANACPDQTPGSPAPAPSLRVGWGSKT